MAARCIGVCSLLVQALGLLYVNNITMSGAIFQRDVTTLWEQASGKVRLLHSVCARVHLSSAVMGKVWGYSLPTNIQRRCPWGSSKLQMTCGAT
eukprot:351893-Chlamydomonas_euryale.AAC.29